MKTVYSNARIAENLLFARTQDESFPDCGYCRGISSDCDCHDDD